VHARDCPQDVPALLGGAGRALSLADRVAQLERDNRLARGVLFDHAEALEALSKALSALEFLIKIVIAQSEMLPGEVPPAVREAGTH
jgi:hypothetical protein